jgi:hypothetical protein
MDLLKDYASSNSDSKSDAGSSTSYNSIKANIAPDVDIRALVSKDEDEKKHVLLPFSTTLPYPTLILKFPTFNTNQ